MAKVKIILFGALVEIAGNSSLLLDDINTTDELKATLLTKFPEFANHTLVFANNNILLKQNTPLKTGDTVSVMPPFSGG